MEYGLCPLSQNLQKHTEFKKKSVNIQEDSSTPDKLDIRKILQNIEKSWFPYYVFPIFIGVCPNFMLRLISTLSLWIVVY